MVDLDSVSTLKRMYEAEKFEDMVVYCKKMLENDEKNLTALQNLAIAFLYLKQYNETIKYCDKVLEINEFDDFALKNKIYSLESLKQHEKIIPICEILLSKDSDDIWALNSMGLALNELGQHQDAISFYDKTLDLDPKNLTALLNKANTLAFLKNYEEAIKVYDLAQKSDSSLKEIAVAKSELYEKLGKQDEAFLAAQGVLNKNMEKIKQAAIKNKCTVFHQFCMNELKDIEEKQQKSMADLK